MLSYDNIKLAFVKECAYNVFNSTNTDEQHYGILSFVAGAKKAEIEKFLNEFKRVWDGTVIDRLNDKNNIALTMLGITPNQRADEIRNLTYKNYFNGPSPDHAGKPGDWWEFGKRVKGKVIYIKLKTYKINRKKKAKCMSFHFAERPIKYPFK